MQNKSRIKYKKNKKVILRCQFDTLEMGKKWDEEYDR